MMKKEKIKRLCAVIVLYLLIIHAIYTVIWRFCPSSPATRWLPMYEWIYGSPNIEHINN